MKLNFYFYFHKIVTQSNFHFHKIVIKLNFIFIWYLEIEFQFNMIPWNFIKIKCYQVSFQIPCLAAEIIHLPGYSSTHVPGYLEKKTIDYQGSEKLSNMITLYALSLSLPAWNKMKIPRGDSIHLWSTWTISGNFFNQCRIKTIHEGVLVCILQP